MKCPHHFNKSNKCLYCLQNELDAAYAELRRLYFGYRVLFDREVYIRSGAGEYAQKAWEEWGKDESA